MLSCIDRDSVEASKIDRGQFSIDRDTGKAEIIDRNRLGKPLRLTGGRFALTET